MSNDDQDNYQSVILPVIIGILGILIIVDGVAQ